MSILQELDELRDQLDERKQEVRGKLRILAPLGFGNDHIAPLLGEYKQQYPQLDIELELSDNPNWASHHKWDIIIYIGALNDSSLKMVTLRANQRFLCASPQYIEAMGCPETPRDLIRHQCIALRENNEDVTLWQFTHRESGKETTVRVTPTLACNEGRVIKDWALSGLGIIMRSEWDVQPQLDSGELMRLLPDYSLPDANIVALLSTPETKRSARVAGFLSLLKDRLAISV
ncbi:LysR substrate-binding domain-containing protein [Aliamphritea spongicola]|nr:LysR substrate-binding domain-containing protein [Aliamphritea spongicola]